MPRPRTSDDGDLRIERISVNVTAAELAEIDKRRGTRKRGAHLRDLVFPTTRAGGSFGEGGEVAMWILVTSAATGNRVLVNLANVDTVSEAPGGSAALIFGGGDSLLIRESLADLTALLGAKSVPVKMDVSGE